LIGFTPIPNIAVADGHSIFLYSCPTLLAYPENVVRHPPPAKTGIVRPPPATAAAGGAAEDGPGAAAATKGWKKGKTRTKHRQEDQRTRNKEQKR